MYPLAQRGLLGIEINGKAVNESRIADTVLNAIQTALPEFACAK